MKIIIEPERSIIPNKIHTTKEYEFPCSGLVTKENMEECLSKIEPIPNGMCGVTLRGSTDDDFFITAHNGKLDQW